ncbi:MAG: beta-mannanase, partial [Burkholderiales bacterium]|nr:beta-mannanase [Opitutaceae bacterium]
HPYPYWTRHTRNDAVNTFRTTLHATAETRFYADIGGKPCFAEELGTMGPMVAGDGVSADFARVNLFSLWANDCRGFLWWCNHDQTALAHAPYDWIGVELELGLFREDGTAKPVVGEIAAFGRFLASLPFPALPPRRREAVCLLTQNQDDWAAAFGSFVLAKQARLELEFRHIQQPIPESDIYLLPSLSGPNCVPRRQWLELVARVRRGATLYLSLGDGIVPHFNELAGVELITRGKSSAPLLASFHDAPDSALPLLGGDDLRFAVRSAEVFASRIDDEQPAFWRNRVGLGMVYVFAAPIEVELSRTPGVFDRGAPAYSKIYDAVAAHRAEPRWFEAAANDLAVTEHILSPDRAVIVVINHTAQARTIPARLNTEASVGRAWHGRVGESKSGRLELAVPGHDACVFELVRVAQEAVSVPAVPAGRAPAFA